jgi:hypothetical protein
VTRKVRRGTLRTGRVAPGSAYALTVVVHRTEDADTGDRRAFTVTATSTSPTARHDAVAVVTRATR